MASLDRDGSTQSELIQTANELAEAVKAFNGDPAEQMALMKKTDKLRLMLESPMDVIMQQWEQTNVLAALHLLVEMGVLEKMPLEGSITTEDLSALVGIDESAIGLFAEDLSRSKSLSLSSFPYLFILQ